MNLIETWCSLQPKSLITLHDLAIGTSSSLDITTPKMSIDSKPPPFSPSEIIVLPLLEDDLLSAAHVMSQAFGPDNPFLNFMFPPSTRPSDFSSKGDERQAAQWKHDFFIHPDGKDKYHVLKAVRKGQEDKVLGVSIWCKPGFRHEELKLEDLEGEELDSYKGVNVENWNKLWVDGCQVIRDEIMKEQTNDSW